MPTGAAEPWDLDVASGLYRLPGSGFGVPKKVFEKLFPYQRDCVRWMFKLSPHAPPHLAPKPPVVSHGALAALRSDLENPKLHGGILADDMGLGKTAQTVSFVASLFHSDLANAVLVACPVSVMPVWEAEFKAWAPEIRVRTYHGSSKAERVKAMRAVQTRGGVLITSYGMLTSDPRSFGGEEVKEDGGAGRDGGDAISTTLDGWLGGGGGSGSPERGGAVGRGGAGAAAKRSARKPAATPAAQLADLDIRFDVVVCDEGHKLKNAATQVARTLRTIPSDMRLLLTGTPVQNSLDELWALMDYVTWGGLLGSRRTFNREIADYIVAGRDRLATAADKRNAADAGQLLSSLVAPYILRREKAVVFAPGAAAGGGAAGGAAGTVAADADAAGAGPDEGAARAGEGVTGGASTGTAAGVPLALLAEKKEVVLWTRMAPLQLHLYAAFLQSEEIKAAMACAKTPLAAITLLRKLACHPLMVKQVAEGQIDIDVGPDAADAAEPECAGGGEGEAEGGAEPGAVPKGPKGGRAGAVASDRANAALAAQQLAALRSAASDAPASFAAGSVTGEGGGEEAVQGFEPPPYCPAGASAGGRAGASALAASPPAGLNLQRIPVPLLLASSGKLQAFVSLMRVFRASGNKVLVFSESLKLLDMVEAVLRAFPVEDAQTADAPEAPCPDGSTDGTPHFSAETSGSGCGRACPEGRACAAAVRIRYVRIDGSVTDAAERRALVTRFNVDERVRVCLLTTGVGALGLTLNSADRVVVISPSWNPAVESQAVDRAYRIGQTRNVVTYRLITAGTVEEKMYRLQVFKGGLTQSVMAATTKSGSDGNLTRFLTKADLKDIFSLGDTEFSQTKRMVDAVCTPPQPRAADLVAHLKELETGPVSRATLGFSHHDHLFSLDGETAERLQRLSRQRFDAAALRGSAPSVSAAGVDTEGAAGVGGPTGGWGSPTGRRVVHDRSPGGARATPCDSAVRAGAVDAGEGEANEDGVGDAEQGALFDVNAAVADVGNHTPCKTGAAIGEGQPAESPDVIDLTSPSPARPTEAAAAEAVAEVERSRGALDELAEGTANRELGQATETSQGDALISDLTGTLAEQSSVFFGRGVANEEDGTGDAADCWHDEGTDDASPRGPPTPESSEAKLGVTFTSNDVREGGATPPVEAAETDSGARKRLSEEKGGEGVSAGTGDGPMADAENVYYTSPYRSPSAAARPSNAAGRPRICLSHDAAHVCSPSFLPGVGGVAAGSVAADYATEACGAGAFASPPPATQAKQSVPPSPVASVSEGSASAVRTPRPPLASPPGGSAHNSASSSKALAADLSSVCSRHLQLCRQAGLPRATLNALTRCSCFLSPDSRELAAFACENLTQHLAPTEWNNSGSGCSAGGSEGESAGQGGPVAGSHAYAALEMAMDALIVCDADPQAHLAAMLAASALGWLPR